VVLETSGGPAYRAAVRSLAPVGRVVVAGAGAAFPRTRNPLARLASIRNLPRASCPSTRSPRRTARSSAARTW